MNTKNKNLLPHGIDCDVQSIQPKGFCGKQVLSIALRMYLIKWCKSVTLFTRRLY